MPLIGTGAPGVFFEVTNQTSNFQRAKGGVVCVLGVTSLGIPYQQRKVSSLEEFRKYFGDIHPKDDFSIYVHRALEYGADLRVARAAHWDSASKTFEGAKASASLTEGANTLAVEALAVGDEYNQVTITISDSKTTLGTFDIIEQYKDAEVNKINRVTLAQIDKINARLIYCKFLTDNLPAQMPKGLVKLQNGTQDVSKITDDDYIGSQTLGNGFHAFDDVLDSMRIFNFNRPSPAVDYALSEYCNKRFDATFFTRPTLLDNQYWETIINYRMGNASTLSSNTYTHTPIDNWLGQMVGGNIYITNPRNSDDKKKVISAIGDVAGLCSSTDSNLGEWWAHAGMSRGQLKNVNGIPDGENYGVTAKKPFWDQLVISGVNMVIRTTDDNTQNPSYIHGYWGNESLMRAPKSDDARRNANVSALVVYMMRVLMPIAKRKQFEPNDPIMWNQIYQRGKPFMRSLVAGRAIFDGWQWNGDQFVSSPTDAKFNKPSDVQLGMYNLQIRFIPIIANQYINVGLRLNDFDSIEEAGVSVG